jgi:hypothetical protein
MILDQELAGSFARIALGHVRKRYPYKLDHVVTGPDDVPVPRDLFPIFFGSFDWHSCVHGWWTLLTLRRLYPDMAEARQIVAVADDSFTAAKVAGELAYFDRPTSRTFERPYGWAWLLQLHLEATRQPDRGWADKLEPLARALAARLHAYLPLLTYPIRVGTHFNTAFAMTLALEWAHLFDPELAAMIRQRALHWFGGDRDCQAWEPGGDEFLSPALSEALCMARTQPAGFATWFQSFLPRLADGEPSTLFMPAVVSDRSDGKIAHLDGLNLSRAWCWRSIAPLLAEAGAAVAEASAERHLAAAMPHVAGDYMGEHWLATFALLALLAGGKG